MEANKISVINKIIDEDKWCDFDISEFDGFNLVVICGIDPPKNWLFRITFRMVSFMSIKNSWKRHKSLPSIEFLDNDKASFLNQVNRIEVGNVLFKINHEDNNTENTNAFIVAAKEIDFVINPKYANRLDMCI